MTGYIETRGVQILLSRVWHLSPNLTIFEGSNPRKQYRCRGLSAHGIYTLVILSKTICFVIILFHPAKVLRI